MTVNTKKRVDIVVRFVLTLSKLAGFLIIVLATAIKFCDKEATMGDWNESVLLASGLIATKTIVQGMLDRKKVPGPSKVEEP